MPDPPVITLPDGTPAAIHLVGERGDMTYVGMADEGVAGFETADGRHVSLLFIKPSDADTDPHIGSVDDTRTTSERLVFGGGGDDE